MSKKKKSDAPSERELHIQRLKKISFITALVTLALLAALAAASLISTVIYSNRRKNGDYLRSEIAAVIGDTEINGAMMSVIFYDNYHTYAPYLDVDTSVSLKKQYTDDGDRLFDLFVRIAKGDATRLLCEAKAASDMGISLTDREKSALEARAEKSELGIYPTGVSAEDIYALLELRALAAKYEAAAKPGLMPTADEIGAYIEGNGNTEKYVDMLAFSVYYSDGSEEEKTLFSEADASAHAKAVAAASDKESFENAVRAVIEEGTPDITDEEKEEYISGLPLTKVGYKADDELSEWAFSAKVGETHTVNDSEACTYTVYLITKEPYLDGNTTESFRLILLSDTDFATHSDTVKKAEELMSAYVSSGRLIDSFAVSAMEYSTDSMSYLLGGFYENIENGAMLPELNEWIFDDVRTRGDAAVVEISGGCAVVLHEGDGLPVWQANARDDMLYDRYNAHCEGLEAASPVLFDETVLNSIPA